MNWTPMWKAKPDKGGYYLVTYADFARKETRVEIDYWDDLGEFWEVFRDDVKAWAPVPEPYSELKGDTLVIDADEVVKV